MPVTARLSKQFYDRLGEAVTNELVDWFNQVDAAYKFDLKEMNELNFARFDAKLDQRVAELRVDLAKIEAKLDTRIDGVEGRLRLVIEKGLRDQTRFFFVAWATLLVTIVAVSLR